MHYFRCRNSISIGQSCLVILPLSILLTLFIQVTYLLRQNENSPPIIILRYGQTKNNSWLDYGKNWNGEILIQTNPTKKEIIFTDEYKIKMISKGLHPLSLKHDRYYKRIERIEKYCSVFPSVNQGRYNLETGPYPVLFNDKAQLLQCQVQKVSSSTWVNVFFNLIENKNIYDRPGIPESDPKWGALSLVSNFSDIKLVAKRYQTYTKFLITRHPFERLLSAYIDKFTRNDNAFETAYAAHLIKANYLSNLKPELIEEVRKELKNGNYNPREELDGVIQQIRRLDAGVGNYEITFAEFLNYIIVSITESGRGSLDYHWAPITVMCDPCTIRYDFIGKFETLHEDSEAILRYIQTNDSPNIVHIPRETPITSENRCNEAFSNIPLNVRNKIYQFYREDFILFDYEYHGDNPDSKFC